MISDKPDLPRDKSIRPRTSRKFWITMASIGLPFWLMTLYLAFYFGSNRINLKELERNVQDVRAAMSVDSIRQHHIQKTMEIIAAANPDMSSDQRYEIADEIYRMSVKYENLNVELLIATIALESGQTWRPDIISQAGAIGLMQVMPATGMFVAYYEGINWTDPLEVLQNPIYNIRIGARYLSAMIGLYGLEGGLAAYNGGERQAALWASREVDENYLHPETRAFVPAVLRIYQQLGG